MPNSPAVPPPWLLADPKVSQGAKLLYVVLADSGETVALPDDLAEQLAVKRRTIDRYLAELRECGAIDTKSHGRAGGVAVEITPKMATKEITPDLAVMPEMATNGPETSPDLAKQAEISPEMATKRDETSPEMATKPAPKTGDSCTSYSPSRSTNPPINPPKRKAEPEDWEPLWQRFLEAYPKRSGDRCVKDGRQRFGLLLKAGVDAAVIMAGLGRYAAWCDATGKTGTELVRQITTWLNKRSWEEPWDLPWGNPTLPVAVNGHAPQQQERWNGRGLRPGVTPQMRAAQLMQMVEESERDG
jgi:hypothetical protein